MIKTIETLEVRMNVENRWTATNVYFELLVTERNKGELFFLNKEINAHLIKYPFVKLKEEIEWEWQQEVKEITFKEFGQDKLSYSMAYDERIMSNEKAVSYLSEFIGYFETNRKFYTNFAGLDEIIEKYGTIESYESKGSYSYSPFDLSENAFSCCLIVVDENKIGSILMRDDD
jgi:hypothetical protein